MDFDQEPDGWTLDDEFYDGTPENRQRKQQWISVFAGDIVPHDLEPIRVLLKAISGEITLSPFDGDFFHTAHCLKGLRKGAQQSELYLFYLPYQYKYGWMVEGVVGRDLTERWFNPRTAEWHAEEPPWGPVFQDWVVVLERVSQ